MRSSFSRNDRARRGRISGFTLLEALATLLVLGLILETLLQFMAGVDRSWKSAAVDPFAEAAEAFETITQNLSVATLEPYRDYADSTGAFRSGDATAFTPYQLSRRSDLDFVCGPSAGNGGLLSSAGITTATTSVFFVAPCGLTQTLAQNGLSHLFNAFGYFLEFGGDSDLPVFCTGASRQRWRLMQVVQPTESLQIFSTSTSAAWIAQLTGSPANTAVMAENVIALAILPERSASDTGMALAPGYAYDSRNSGNALTFGQLPPRVRVVLAAIDENSAIRLAAANGGSPPGLVPSSAFQAASQVGSDVTALDASLTAARIGHRIFQRDIQLATAAWSNTP